MPVRFGLRDIRTFPQSNVGGGPGGALQREGPGRAPAFQCRPASVPSAPVAGACEVSLLCGDSGCKRLDVSARERLTADAPVTAADLFDDDPGDRPHVLAFDVDNRLGETLDDVVLLLGGEDVFDDFDVDEWHGGSPTWW